MNFSFNYGEKTYTIENFKESNNKFYCDLGEGVSVTAIREIYKTYNAEEWILWFENSGKKDSQIFSDIKDCNIIYKLKNPNPYILGQRPTLGFPCVTAMKGMVFGGLYHQDDQVSSTEYNTYDVYLIDEEEEKNFKNVGGRSSDGMMPFFDLHTKESGIIIAIGWTGSWQADFKRNDDTVTVKTGLQRAMFYLKSGEKLRTSSVLIMEYDKEDKYNKFRSLIKNHFSHTANTSSDREGLLAFELWGSMPSELMVERLNQLRDHNIRFDDIWIDAGWYGEGKVGPSAYDPGWFENTGYWIINKDIHPNCFRDVRDAAKEAGSNLMLWFEPERTEAGTPMVKEHPEWYFDNYMLYYGNEDALEYAYQVISEQIEKLELSCYRQDFNFCPDVYFEKNDEKDRMGVTEIKHIMGLYRLWDKLLENYPHLLIDNCSAGGRRLDIETFKRAIPFFRSDYQCLFNENSMVLQTHNAGIAKYVPMNGCTSKTKADVYAMRSSYSTSWGVASYSTVFQTMSEDDFILLKNRVDEYRRIRKYFSCNFYNHGSERFDYSSWAIWQYHDVESQSGIVMAFRREESPFENVEIELKGTIADKEYLFENLDTKTTFYGNNKLKINLSEKRSCVIFEYKIG